MQGIARHATGGQDSNGWWPDGSYSGRKESAESTETEAESGLSKEGISQRRACTIIRVGRRDQGP